MSDISENLSLPPGWDAKYDFKTGKRYYINHFTKHTSLEDPRIKYKKLQAGESLAFSSYQSSPIRSFSPQPFYHVHQDANFSSGRPSPIMGRSYSPLMGSNAIHYLAQKPHEYPTLETSVSKIKALFPTVGETHIKALLHKYHYREAVVVSALQVEKHPLTTPGPYSSPLSAARHVIAQITPSAPGSPGRFSFSSAFRNLSPRKTPHSSPKMKLRYLKGMFPVVDETVLLDTLCNSENNVHKASETLMTMGFLKKDSLPFKHSIKKNEEESYSSEKDLKNDSIFISLHDPSPKFKTTEEKAIIKKKLEEKFPKMAERIVILALETADYDVERAEQFLNATSEEKKSSNENCDLIIKEKQKQTPDDTESSKIEDKSFRDSGIWAKVSPDSLGDKTTATPSSTEQTEAALESNENSIQNRQDTTLTLLPTPKTPTMANTISQNYLTKSKTGIKLCAKIFPKGPNKSLLGSRYAAKGPNPNLSCGPKILTKKNFNKIAESHTSNRGSYRDISNGQCAIL